MIRIRFLLFAWPLVLTTALAWGQGLGADTPGPVGGVPARLPEIEIPQLTELRLAVPRPVRAATAALGLGRQRLALVVGIGTIGARRVLDSAPRDTQAVAAALRALGFVVMVREDSAAASLRADLAEFRARLQPDGVGFVYVTALGAQVQGQNLLLPRETVLALAPAPEPAELVARLRGAGVPVSEVVSALTGPAGSPRLLVVDAAYRHPALAGLPQPGLAEQKLPPGVMALFANALGVVQEVVAAAPLPAPAASAQHGLAASGFARALVAALGTPRISGAEALRSVRRSLFESSQGRLNPWLAGDTDERDELADPTLLDSLIPRTPEEVAREALRQGERLLRQPGAAHAGEQTVAEVLQQSGADATAPQAGPATRPAPDSPGAGRAQPQAARPSAPGTPGTLAGAVGAVADVAATAAALAGGAGRAAAVLAVPATGSVAGNVAALAARAAAGGTGEQPARAAAQAALARVPAPAASPIPAPGGAVAAPALAPPAPAPTSAPTSAPTPALATLAGTARRVATGVPQNTPNGAPHNAAPATDGRTARTGERGERPVYLPRTNAFGYAEGDTFTYQLIDTWKGEVTGATTTAIEEVLGDGQLLANGAQMQMDAQGRLKSLHGADGSQVSYEPSQQLWWSNPRRGESRDVLFKESFRRADGSRGQTEWSGTTRVGRARRIEIPAGEFDALPIESSGWYDEALADGSRSRGQWSRTVWYSPKLGHPVAIDIEDADPLGRLLKRERMELTHAQSARSAP